MTEPRCSVPEYDDYHDREYENENYIYDNLLCDHAPRLRSRTATSPTYRSGNGLRNIHDVLRVSPPFLWLNRPAKSISNQTAHLLVRALCSHPEP